MMIEILEATEIEPGEMEIQSKKYMDDQPEKGECDEKMHQKYTDEQMNEIIEEAKQAAIESSIEVQTAIQEVGCGEFSSYISPVAPVRSKVFKSSLVVVEYPTKKFEVFVPLQIWTICNELQTKVGSNEFSIVCKGKFDRTGKYIIGSDYRVPNQEVAGAKVDYDNEDLQRLKLEGWNVVIHSHPFNSRSSNFSSDDRETINTHFDCSILFSCKEFTFSTMSFPIQNGIRLVVESDVTLEGSDIVPASEYNKINQHKTYANQFDYWGDWGYGGRIHNQKAIEMNREITRYARLNKSGRQDTIVDKNYEKFRAGNEKFRETLNTEFYQGVYTGAHENGARDTGRGEPIEIDKKKIFKGCPSKIYSSNKKIREPKTIFTKEPKDSKVISTNDSKVVFTKESKLKKVD